MVDSESWGRVNINMEEMGGVLNILKKNSIIASRCKYSSGNDSERPTSILMSFLSAGNPFRPPQEEAESENRAGKGGMAENGGDSGEKKKGVWEFTEEKEIQSEEDEREGVEEKEGDKGVAEGEGGVGEEGEEAEGVTQKGNAFELFMRREPTPSPSPRTPHTPLSPLTPLSHTVVTQTCLNGLARYTGRYLQLMFLVPNTAADIFSSLCQLYDYYLCAVYCGFVPPDKQRVRGGKASAVAPVKQGEFEVRHS